MGPLLFFLVGGCSWQPWRPQEQTNKEAETLSVTGQRHERAAEDMQRPPGFCLGALIGV